MKKKVISTTDAPRAIGAYNQGIAIESGRLVFISGQLGLNPQTMELVSGGVAAEARQAMENIKAIVTAAGGSMASIVKATVLLADIKDFTAVNEIYASFFSSDYPARAAFAAAALPKGARVEIEAIAAL